MTVGLHTVNLANKWLDMLGGTAFTAPAVTAMKLHTADPGAAATTAASAETTRKALTWSAAASGSKSITTTLPQWAGWTAGSETISHVSVWDSTTAGNVLLTAALAASKPMTNGDTLNITAFTVSFTPLMA
jgi:hypothetical protein